MDHNLCGESNCEIRSNPQFVNAPTDLRLAAGSPAIGAASDGSNLGALPQPSITAGAVGVNPEGDSGSTIWNLPVTLSNPSASAVTVDWATLDVPSNSAIAHPGSDYVGASGTLTFAPGETTKNVQIEVLGDTVDEPPLLWGEWGLVQLSNPTNATVDTGGLFGLGLFIIIDDDEPV
jgi:hypothetical protein